MESLRFPAAVFVKFSFSYGNINSMTREDFENQFLKLIYILISMKNVYMPCFLLPNGDTISIVIYSNTKFGRVSCFKGSLTIYKFNTNRDDKDHLKILAEYIYKQHNDDEHKEILDNLKVEMVKQV